MTVIELPDEQAATLKAKAAAQGLRLEGWFKHRAEEETGPRAKPLKSAYGLPAQYRPAPSAEKIDENRCDMFRGFGAEALPQPPLADVCAKVSGLADDLAGDF